MPNRILSPTRTSSGATVPVGQLPQALVYVPNATSSDKGTANLQAAGCATAASHLALVPPPGIASRAHASVSINSLGLIDNLQLAAAGLEAGRKYRLVLVASPNRQDLATFSAGIGGTAIVQTFGPLKQVGADFRTSPAIRLEIRLDGNGMGDLVLEQKD